MSGELVTAIYIVSSVLFIFSIALLSKPETSIHGNVLGIIGMALALITTMSTIDYSYTAWIILAIIVGGIIGIYLATQVHMTAMPELVAMLHSFVGFSSILIGFNSYLYKNYLLEPSMQFYSIHLIEVFLGIFIGSMTFSGSITAFSKLRGYISPRPLRLIHRHTINVTAFVISLLLLVIFIHTNNIVLQTIALLMMTFIAIMFGWHMVASIGGADMPVVISMLNSYSGWSAAATGFMLNNDLLIVTGALVGSSGAILSYIMCRAMNRSFISVITGGGFSENNILGLIKKNTKLEEAIANKAKYQETTVQEVATLLQMASSVIIVPGYGMAVAQAQYPVAKLTAELRRKYGVKVIFGIHPIAGRLPGHMNVLLAEAKVSYDIVLGMEEINDKFKKTDIVLVIGANDTVNPAAQEDSHHPLTGMPVLKVWTAHNVIVFKRTEIMNTGYAGVHNPLFFKKNTKMLFGDAKYSLEAIIKAIE
ncbi:MAG: Re/Si-specific NAD(P)(+) transhydrogenase subunit beta [Candidatus Dasytiphilus stammeri]